MKLIVFLAQAGVFVLSAALLAGLAGSVHPALDSFGHFRLHFAALLLLHGLVAWILKNWKWGVASAIIAVSSVAMTWPYLPFQAAEASKGPYASSKPNIRVVQFNLYFQNWDIEAAQTALETAEADFLLLQEVTFQTKKALKGVATSHPYQVHCDFRGVGGVAIVSRHPFANDNETDCSQAFGIASARFNITGREVTVASIHSYWPWPGRQSRQLALLKPRLEKMQHPLIIAGDFNSVPWSAAVGSVARSTRTTIAPGLVLTWAPFKIDANRQPWLSLPIDNILLSGDLALQNRDTLDQAGSDHLPILSEFSWNG